MADWWKQDLGPPMPKRPWKYRPKGTPRGNPNFAEIAKEGRKIAPFVPGDPRIQPNFGGVVKESNKSIRKALLRLMNEDPDDRKAPKSKADDIARRLYDLAQSSDPKVALAAIRELTDRTDGRAAPSKEEVDAIAAGARMVVIDARMRPARTEPLQIEPTIDLLPDSSGDNEEEEDEDTC